VTTFLNPNEVVIAIRKASTENLLTHILESISGANPVFNVSKCGLGCSLSISYQVREVQLHLATPEIVVDTLNLDTTLQFQLSLDFSNLYDCLSSILPLPPRCLTLCIPFTNICATKCLDLGSIGLPVAIPLSFSLSGLYELKEEVVIDDDGQPYWHVYLQIDFITPLVLDVARTIQRICDAIASELPWPLSIVAGDLCSVFGQVFDVLENAINTLAVELTDLFFKATGGWVGIQLKFAPIYKLRQNAVPGTSNPAIPALINSLTSVINSANELDVRFLLMPAP